MDSALSIRPYANDDRPQVVALWRDVLPSSQPWNDPDTVISRKLRVQDGLFFVGEISGRIVGTVMAGYDGVRGWIYALAVAGESRCRGYGGQLLAHAERTLARRGCQKINLQVRSDNSAVVDFYNKCGYTQEDRLSLGKPLPEDDGKTWVDHVPTLDAGAGIELSQIRLEDRASYLQHFNETELFHRYMLLIPYPYTESDADEWLARVRRHTLEFDRMRHWAIRDESGRMIGGIGLVRVDIGEQAEIGYWLAKPWWGRGTTSRAVACLARHAFAEYRLIRLSARVLAGNLQSARVLEKAGFEHEGLLRKHVFHDGTPLDVHYYGMIKKP